MPRARWLFGCNDIAAYKTNGANGVNGFDGRNGENGRCVGKIVSGFLSRTNTAICVVVRYLRKSSGFVLVVYF